MRVQAIAANEQFQQRLLHYEGLSTESALEVASLKVRIKALERELIDTKSALEQARHHEVCRFSICRALSTADISEMNVRRCG
jgi:hypothetical protein